MPIYEYKCEKCNELFEKMQKITDDPIENCIYCQGPVHRIISRSTFILKGTGWYATDYARKDKSKNNGRSSHASSGNSKSAASEASDAKETKDSTTSTAQKKTEVAA